jgi:hypothetical protein
MTQFILTTTFNFSTLKQKPRSPRTVPQWNGNDSRNKHHFPFGSHVTSDECPLTQSHACVDHPYDKNCKGEICRCDSSEQQDYRLMERDVIKVYLKDRGSRFLRNLGTHLPNCMVDVFDCRNSIF